MALVVAVVVVVVVVVAGVVVPVVVGVAVLFHKGTEKSRVFACCVSDASESLLSLSIFSIHEPPPHIRHTS